jgi:hypothetical protein
MKNTARSMKQKTGLLTHEQFIAEVANAAISLVPHEERSDLLNAKLTYGAGKSGLRGITYYDKWLTSDDEKAAFVEICSFGESSPVQLAGTTIHELGHVLAGFKAGHSKQWKCACEGLGLRRLQAAGTEYKLAMFHPDIRATIVSLIERLEPAKPGQGHFAPTGPQKPCSAGTGSRGGASMYAPALHHKASGPLLIRWIAPATNVHHPSLSPLQPLDPISTASNLGCSRGISQSI